MNLDSIVEVRPLEDSRWKELVDKHPASSVFHSMPWLEALHRTYGYEPIAVSASADRGPLDNGLLFCGIDSWLTGHRWVSLPFSDHCSPLLDGSDQLQMFLPVLERLTVREGLRYLEIRPLEPLAHDTSVSSPGHWQPGMTYCLHRLDLRPDLDTLFRNCHKDSTQRKIRRAEREKLRYEEGRSNALLEAFYRLLILTRQRHGLPPQPRSWFWNLAEAFGGVFKVRVAFRDSRAIAAIITIRHKDTLVYKYGCSDARYNNLGGTHLLFWNSIEEAKRQGLRTFDLGRSDTGNTGLITFKNHWGAACTTLSYSTFTPSWQAPSAMGINCEKVAKQLIGHLPSRVLPLVGRLMYRHIG